MMKLYVLPGACSLASHIALEQAVETIPSAVMPAFEVIVVERGRNHDPVYRAINELGTVPALVTKDGVLIVESVAVLLHMADFLPGAALVPLLGDPGRDRVHTLLSAMVTSAHPAFRMLWRSERFADSDEGQAAVQRMAEARLEVIFNRFEKELDKRDFLLGERITIADMYLYVLGRWGLRLSKPTTLFPNLWRFSEGMSSMPAVRRAMTREGIALQGPSSGLG